MIVCKTLQIFASIPCCQSLAYWTTGGQTCKLPPLQKHVWKWSNSSSTNTPQHQKLPKSQTFCGIGDYYTKHLTNGLSLLVSSITIPLFHYQEQEEHISGECAGYEQRIFAVLFQVTFFTSKKREARKARSINDLKLYRPCNKIVSV